MRATLRVAGQIMGLSGVVEAQQELGGIRAVVQIRRAARAVGVERFEVDGRVTRVAQRQRHRPGGREGAVGGDVVGHELTEEGPAGGDGIGRISALDVDHRPAIAGATGIADGPEQCLVSEEGRELRKEAAVGVRASGRVDRP